MKRRKELRLFKLCQRAYSSYKLRKEIRKRIENKAELRKKKLKEEAERKAREAKQKAIVEAAAKKAAGQKKAEMFADSGSGGWGGAEMFAGKLPVAPGGKTPPNAGRLESSRGGAGGGRAERQSSPEEKVAAAAAAAIEKKRE